ncbi:class I SAM-dependent DNA methyltransferase [Denitromonas iodatirespirans]|uniref:site-specific DNA-methyltransferase (adenine-specific) n=1 Tax=Denitromonas iodatirespirans TaxID=2795389 RepID=A0A944DEK0_DENI1|nr:DNA methyltransferase [Denitromonas iodatirespirans]MBT0962998.1 class I SAM-dependent DNA methyltransferase [Denitromonas iodatirespirans]
MPLSWNEIRSRALAFSREWADESSENAEAKSFWDAFFTVFGLTRRRVASFETPVKKGDGKGGFIDLLWRGVLLVEHKSRGKDLDKAIHQAFEYFPGLKERDLPRFVLVSDFAHFRLYDLDENAQHDFELADLHKNIKLFGFVAGYQSRSFGQEDPVNIQAAERLGKLHDLLKESGYDGHPLEVLLVRLLFCVFAEDTAIFERRQFTEYVEQRTSEDGTDLGPHLAQLFQVLDTPHHKRQKTLDEQLTGFPYVNGKLFREMLPLANFNRAMREMLLDCGSLDWSRISPAVFGSLFQSIMDAAARRNLGAHYTTETNILKALGPLFLDELRAEFERVKFKPKALPDFHKRLVGIHVLDPACGCGNFLVIAYRELRLLELDILRALELIKKTQHLEFDLGNLVQVGVEQFYGIEIEDFPAQIAQVAMWLTDHQMNMRVSEEFGQYFVRLPLTQAPNIVHKNALTLDWASVVPPKTLSYIVGNPPFGGKHYQNRQQKAELRTVFTGVRNASDLDFVAAWFRKATDFMAQNEAIRTAFVSTNSITQGEQVGILWPDLISRGVKIHFAHRTFQWSSEARGRATVHCVIIGFALHDNANKVIFDYETPQGEPHAVRASNINPYLADAPNVIARKRQQPFLGVPTMRCGNKPTDGGHLLLTTAEKEQLLRDEPAAAPWIRRFVGAAEFINGIDRWCLWLDGIDPRTLRAMPKVLERVEAVRRYRSQSSAEPTRKMADIPTRFFFRSQPTTRYILMPEVSSERRRYVPVGVMGPEIISSNKNYLVAEPSLYLFGLLQSAMHMAWLGAVGGRLESRFQYSASLVYNTFPWPTPTANQKGAIEAAAQGILNARAKFPASTLGDLYDPLAMPAELLKAHKALDKAVDSAYEKSRFSSEAERVAFLFRMYEQLEAPIAAPQPTRTTRRVRKADATSVVSTDQAESSGLQADGE